MESRLGLTRNEYGCYTAKGGIEVGLGADAGMRKRYHVVRLSKPARSGVTILQILMSKALFQFSLLIKLIILVYYCLQFNLIIALL